MNSETISVIEGICCLFLAIVLFLFRHKITILLDRLARIEFRSAESQQIKTEKKVSGENRPWAWYKAWIISLLHPNDITGKALVEESNITVKQTCLWIVVGSIIYQFLYSIILWIKFPYSINLSIIFRFITNCLLAGLLIPISIIILAGLIHIIAKLFRARGTYLNFLIIYTTFNFPVLLIFIASSLIFQVFRVVIFQFLGVVLAFYLLFVVTTRAIKANYHFHWLGALLINLFVQIVFFSADMVFLIMLNPKFFIH